MRVDTAVTAIVASEILDSRGVPTIEVLITAETANGPQSTRASVPSGKSTGKHEAVERRDGDKLRYAGQGVLGAVDAVNREIGPQLIGKQLPPQRELDAQLIALDGTPNKARLGANAILGVSLAMARLRAQLDHQPLAQSLASQFELTTPTMLPVPCLNVINGGAHAPNALEFQEFMLVPAGFSTFGDALRAGAETYHSLASIMSARGLATSVGDEGGFAPAIEHPDEALDLMVAAIEHAGYLPGEEIFIALDPAANGFFAKGLYTFAGQSIDAQAMTAMYRSWLGNYPIISIEDGLAEDDIDGWVYQTRELGRLVQLVGDDIFVSEAGRVANAIKNGIGNAVLLKPNQVGTLAEIVETARVAHVGGFRTMLSHRSGETDDPFVADLAVALGSGQIKAGAPARGERVAKYNELLRIETQLGAQATFAGLKAFASTDEQSA